MRLKPNEYLVSYCAFISGISFGEWPTSISETTTTSMLGKARKPDTGSTLSLFLDWISGEGGSDHVSRLSLLDSFLNVARIENLRSE